MAQDHRGLVVWQTALELVLDSYRLSQGFPSQERFDLTSQLRRAAVSVPANIAEGNGRVHRGEYIHHLSIARGSLMELHTHLEIARRLGYVREAELSPVRDRVDHVSRLLHRLIRSLQN